MGFASFGSPADKTVGACKMAHRRRPAQAGNRLPFGVHQVLQMFSRRLCVTEVVILLDEAVEEWLLHCAARLLKLQRSQLVQRPAHWSVVGHDRFRARPPLWPVVRWTLGWWQLNLTGAIQLQE